MAIGQNRAEGPLPPKTQQLGEGSRGERKVCQQSVKSRPGKAWVLSSEPLFGEGPFLVPKGKAASHRAASVPLFASTKALSSKPEKANAGGEVRT